jgi:hypothetical protein
MDRLQKSMNVYIKSLSRRGETFDDKEKGLPVSYLGRTMIAHGEDFDPDSEFGNCLIGMCLGRASITPFLYPVRQPSIHSWGKLNF